MVDVQPTQNLTIEPAPIGDDMPMMGNPILMRTSGRTRPSGVRTTGSRATASRSGWRVALPVAAVVVIAGAAGAYFFAKSSQTQPLTTAPPTVTASATAPVTEPAPVLASTAAPTAAAVSATEKPIAPELAPRHEHVTSLARADRIERHAAVRHARTASDEGADVSATAPMAAPAPAPAPSAPPVISPPPAQ